MRNHSQFSISDILIENFAFSNDKNLALLASMFIKSKFQNGWEIKAMKTRAFKWIQSSSDQTEVKLLSLIIDSNKEELGLLPTITAAANSNKKNFRTPQTETFISLNKVSAFVVLLMLSPSPF